MVWWIARYLFVIVAVLAVTMELGMTQDPTWWTLGCLVALLYAIATPLRALDRKRKREWEAGR